MESPLTHWSLVTSDGGNVPLKSGSSEVTKTQFLPMERQSKGSILNTPADVGLCSSLGLSQSGGSILFGLFCLLDLKLVQTR